MSRSSFLGVFEQSVHKTAWFRVIVGLGEWGSPLHVLDLWKVISLPFAQPMHSRRTFYWRKHMGG